MKSHKTSENRLFAKLRTGRFLIILIIVLLFIPEYMNAQNSEIIAKGAGIKKLAGDFSFTEGPASDSKGNVYFTDQPNNKIIKWSVDGKVEVFMDEAGRSNGLYFDNNGQLIACSEEDNQLWAIDPDDKAVTILHKGYAGKKFNGPNDLWILPDGGIFFTDPYYQRSWWNHNDLPQDGQHVYYLNPDGSTLKRVTEDLVQPNGIIGTPDGKILYIADIKAKKTWRYTIGPEGNLLDKKLFADMGSDGMTIDNKGNVYLTGDGVTIFNPQGEKIEHIKVDERWTANVCFGGKKHKMLFITASNSVYGLDMKVRGGR
jgi:gluconolactonase